MGGWAALPLRSCRFHDPPLAQQRTFSPASRRAPTRRRLSPRRSSGRPHRKDRIDRAGQPARLLVRSGLDGMGRRPGRFGGSPHRGRRGAENSQPRRLPRAPAERPPSRGVDRRRPADRVARRAWAMIGSERGIRLRRSSAAARGVLRGAGDLRETRCYRIVSRRQFAASVRRRNCDGFPLEPADESRGRFGAPPLHRGGSRGDGRGRSHGGGRARRADRGGARTDVAQGDRARSREIRLGRALEFDTGRTIAGSRRKRPSA